MMEGVQLSEDLAMRLQAMEFAHRIAPRSAIKRKDNYKTPPSLARPVRIFHNTTLGKCVQQNSSGYHPGKLQKWHTGDGVDSGDIWIVVMDGDSLQTTREGSPFIGHYAGRATHGGISRPLYIVQQGQIEFQAKADSAIAVGANGAASIWTGGIDSIINVTAYHTWGEGNQAIPAGAEILVRWFPDESIWLAIPLKGSFKSLVRFTLDAALALTDASKAATITAQYGLGVDNTTSITVNNLAITAGGYLFEGASGAAGLAMHDTGTEYRIIQMECPA